MFSLAVTPACLYPAVSVVRIFSPAALMIIGAILPDLIVVAESVAVIFIAAGFANPFIPAIGAQAGDIRSAAFRTDKFAGVSGRYAVAVQHCILTCGNSTEVFRIAARSVAADMVYLERRRDSPVNRFPKQPVNKPVPVLKPDLRVPIP